MYACAPRQDQEDDDDGFKPSFNNSKTVAVGGYGAAPAGPMAPAQHLVVNTSSSGTPRTTVYRGNPPEYEDRNNRGTTPRPGQRNGRYH